MADNVRHDEQHKPDKPRRRGPVSRWLGHIFGVLAALLLLLTLLGFLGDSAWWLDVLNQGRMQYLWCSLVVGLILLAARAWGWLGVAVVAVAINAWLVLPWFFGSTPQAAAAQRDLRLMALNVRGPNEEFAPILDLLRREEPDLVVLNEVDPAWLKQIRDLDTGYEIHDTPAQGRFGVLLLARHPIASVEIERFTEQWSPSLIARLEVEGRPAVLIATHAPAPTGSKAWKLRNEHFREIRQYVDDLGDPVLVAGDLNVTMWSPHFDQLLNETGLNETRDGYGVAPTFPASRWGLDLPWALRVPLDHVLASGEWAVLDCWNGPNVGSDHLPLLVDLMLRPADRELAGR